MEVYGPIRLETELKAKLDYLAARAGVASTALARAILRDGADRFERGAALVVEEEETIRLPKDARR